MNIDTLDVLDTASTKWNFLNFRPGLVGGHCIGIDPYYLTYIAKKKGYKIYLAFIIQREDCRTFRIANDIDPKYSKTLSQAVKKNLKILCYDCKFSSKGIKLNQKIKFKI